MLIDTVLNIGLSFGELMTALVILATIIGGYTRLQVKLSELTQRMDENEKRIKENAEDIVKAKDETKSEIQALICENKADHNIISNKIDANHKTVMEVLLRMISGK